MTDIFLRIGETNPGDVKLRDTTIPDWPAASLIVTGAGNIASAEAIGSAAIELVMTSAVKTAQIIPFVPRRNLIKPILVKRPVWNARYQRRRRR